MNSQYGSPFYETATHATSAVASHTGVAGSTHYVTDISGSSDKATSVLLVKDGTTTIWQVIVGVGNFTHSFKEPLRATSGALVSVTVDGTAAATANIAGFTV